VVAPASLIQTLHVFLSVELFEAAGGVCIQSLCSVLSELHHKLSKPSWYPQRKHFIMLKKYLEIAA
jgi:hypothetical protein